MKLLTQTLPRVRELLRPSGWFTLAVVLALVALETVGRVKTDSDFHDALAACGLLVVAFAVVQRHRQERLGWVGALNDGLTNVVGRLDRLFKMELGLDLRGTPPIPRKSTALVGLFGVLVLWNGVALAAWYWSPDGWREFGVRVFYLGYLASVMALWVTLFSELLVGVYFPLSLAYQALLVREDGTMVPRMGMTCLLAYMGLVILAEWFLPPVIILYICSAVVVGAMAVLAWPARAEIQFIWRGETGGKVWSVPSLRLVAAGCVLCVLLMTGLILSACGGRVLAGHESESKMPLTVLMGSTLAWLTPGIFVTSGVVLALIWWRNPARRTRATVEVTGMKADRREVTRILQGWGFRVRWSDKPKSGAIAIKMVDASRSEAREFDPNWPLKLSVEDLRAGEVRDRLERRDEIQLRRQLLRGLEKLFKETAGKKNKGGSGYWLAPHLWFVSGLTRDEPEPESDKDDANVLLRVVGTPYHKLFPRRVRQYVYRTLRAMQIDLVFVEDGVSYRKLSSVLRTIFDVFDRHAGKRRAEEIQFTQVPKVRVLIHEFQIDQPFKSEVYPEPKFEDLGRARILHVFRDRGGQEDPLEAPWDTEYSPSPLMFV